MSTELFYQNLNNFSSFNGITHEDNFQDIPSDWYVVITDVKGSTKAIENGRYKDVNTIGAATIVAAQESMGDIEFPYVFGGDGATLLIPASKIEQVTLGLLKLRRLSEKKFKLGLRVGVISVRELLEQNSSKKDISIKLAKFELNAGKCMAMFKGGGLSLAENLIKNQEEKYAAKNNSQDLADLSGLSCRWRPIPNKRGIILSLLIEARTNNHDSTYLEILHQLDHIFEGEIEEANPVNIEKVQFDSYFKCLKNEIRYQKSMFSFSFLMRFMKITIGTIVFKLKIPIMISHPEHYKNALRTHSDYRKFDDMLRMIIDCSKKQALQIEKYLEDLYKSRAIYYGIHQSKNSLITCYVGSLQDGDHIHFIDGDNGGYAMAAKQLKSQMSKEES